MSLSVRKISKSGKVSVVYENVTGEIERNKPPLPKYRNTIEDAMERKGSRLRTPSGYNHDESSSSMQKSVRRMMPEESVRWALEGFFTSNSSRTNMWNRLMVMCLEDVSPKDHWILSTVYENFTKRRDDPIAFGTCVYEIAKAKKSRVNDWALLDSKYRYIADRRNRGVGDMVKSSRVVYNPDPKFDQKRIGRKFVKAFSEKDLTSMLYICANIWYSGSPLQNPVKMGTLSYKSQAMLWKLFATMSKGKNGSKELAEYGSLLFNVFKLKNWRYSLKSELLWPAFCNVYVAGVSKNRHKFEPDKKLIQPIIDDINDERGIVGVPLYSIDKHTASGRRKNLGIEHFISYPSSVVDEDEDFVDVINSYIESVLKNMSVNLEGIIADAYLSHPNNAIVLSYEDSVWYRISEEYGNSVGIFTSNKEKGRYDDVRGENDDTFPIQICGTRSRSDASKCIGDDKDMKNRMFIYDPYTKKPSVIDLLIPARPVIELANMVINVDDDGDKVIVGINQHQITVMKDSIHDTSSFETGMIYIGDRTKIGKRSFAASPWVNRYGNTKEGLENYIANLFLTGKVYDILGLREMELVCQVKTPDEMCNGHVLVAIIELFDRIIQFPSNYSGKYFTKLVRPKVSSIRKYSIIRKAPPRSSASSKKSKVERKKNPKGEVVCVRVDNLRQIGYDNIKEWIEDDGNVYVGRASSRIRVDGESYKIKESKFHNPFSLKKKSFLDSSYRKKFMIWRKDYSEETRKNKPYVEALKTEKRIGMRRAKSIIEKSNSDDPITAKESVDLYKIYLIHKIKKGSITEDDLRKLKNKNLGCWCTDGVCHAQFLKKVVDSI